MWARLHAQEATRLGIQRLVLTQVAFTLSSGYYFYFVLFLSQGPLQLDARRISYLFIFFGGLSIVFNYGFFTYLADRLPQRRTIIWLAVLGAAGLRTGGDFKARFLRAGYARLRDPLTYSRVIGWPLGSAHQRG